MAQGSVTAAGEKVTASQSNSDGNPELIDNSRIYRRRTSWACRLRSIPWADRQVLS
jgi:hypothetical protein